MKTPECNHTCRGLCTALELASSTERKAILHYAALRDECTYPDVRALLNEIILQQKKTIELIEQTKQMMATKFEVLDQIREGFEVE